MTSAVVALALLAPAAPPAAPDVKENVRNGLKWLASQQKPDGHWESLNGSSQTTTTAHAGVAFLMEGSTPARGAYAGQLRKALAWLEKNTAADGQLASNDPNERFQHVPSHAQALLFLACAYDVDDDPDRRARLGKMLDKAVAFAVSCQTARGGWGFTKPAPNRDFDDGMTTATVLQALLAARKVGIDVPKPAIDKGLQYLIRSTNRDGGIIYSNFGQAPMGGDGYPVISAAAAGTVLTGEVPRPEQLALWVKFGHRDAISQLQYLGTNAAGNLGYHYHAARVAYAVGEQGHAQLHPDTPAKERVTWSVYRARTFKALAAVQTKDGFWRDEAYGPAYSTALALIILQLDNDHLPAFSR